MIDSIHLTQLSYRHEALEDYFRVNVVEVGPYDIDYQNKKDWQINRTTEKDGKMNISISHLTKEDRQDWQRLYEGYAVFYKVPMNDDILNQVWDWIFDETIYCIVAKDENGRAIGLMHYRAMPSPLRGSMVGFLDDLFVEPEVRGQGAVDALFGKLKEEAQSHGWKAIRWITGDDNYRARGVYDKIAKKTAWNLYQLDL